MLLALLKGSGSICSCCNTHTPGLRLYMDPTAINRMALWHCVYYRIVLSQKVSDLHMLLLRYQLLLVGRRMRLKPAG